jgi:hypothetical protein
MKGKILKSRFLDAEDDSRSFLEERAEGKSSESLFSPLIRYAVRIYGKSSGSFFPSTLPRNEMFRKGTNKLLKPYTVGKLVKKAFDQCNNKCGVPF